MGCLLCDQLRSRHGGDVYAEMRRREDGGRTFEDPPAATCTGMRRILIVEDRSVT